MLAVDRTFYSARLIRALELALDVVAILFQVKIFDDVLPLGSLQ